MALLSSTPRSLIAFLLLLLTSTVHSQAAVGAITAENSVDARIFPGNANFNYTGCYGETTLNNATNGLRTLNGGTMEDLTTMTVGMCLDFCGNAGYAFAGLEYTKECWCAYYLSSIAPKLADSECNLACIGNTTQVCGGALKLSVYQVKSKSGKSAAVSTHSVSMGSLLALGIAVGVALCMS